MECSDCGQELHIGDWPFPCGGRGHQIGAFWSGDSNIHPSEQIAIDYNPRTGVERIPGRGDRDVHPKLAAEGFVRKRIETHSELAAFEKRKGFISEVRHYNRNSVQAERDTGSV